MASNPIQRIRRFYWSIRLAGLLSETLFWWRWIRTGGANWRNDFKARLNSRKPLIEAAVKHVSELASDPIRILDVGAGPITVLGYHLEGRNVEITAVDVLAKTYAKLLWLSRIVPPVQTVYADAERLDEYVKSDYFDFAYAQNSIDHSLRPWLAVEQMVKAVKPGRVALIRTHENEGSSGDYSGLHPWNFTERDGNFVIWNDRQEMNMTNILSSVAEVKTTRVHDFILVEMRKVDRH